MIIHFFIRNLGWASVLKVSSLFTISSTQVPGELPYEKYTGVCQELGSYFQEKIPKRVCQFFTKIPEKG